MSKKERFQEAFFFLKKEGIFKSQIEVANAMDASPSNISSALAGNERVLTDSFLTRFARSFKQISLEWLLYEEGQMLTIAAPNFKSENTPQILESDTDKDIIEEQDKMTERIMELIRESQYTPKTFALESNIEVSLFEQKLKGKRVWSVADIHKICDTFNIRKSWLVDGDGQKFRATNDVLETIPALPSKYTKSQIEEILDNVDKQENDNKTLLNASELFTDQALRIEKFIVMLSDEISEVRSIKQELALQKEEKEELQKMLHDAIFALRSANKTNGPTLMAADDGDSNK